MRRGAFIGAILLVGLGVVLGATVFRTDIAQATGLDKQAQNVIVKNTPQQAVPVTDSNTTQLLWSGNLGGPNGSTPDLDVSGYSHIRIGAAAIGCGQTGNDDLSVDAVESGQLYSVDSIHPCDGSLGGSGIHRSYDVPGRTLRITCFCAANTGVFLAVFGRAN